MTGRLVLCGVPIGNVGDASPRLREALLAADVVAAEDTRRAHRLASGLGIELQRVVAHHEHNEDASAAGLVALMLEGQSIALVTDAGMPSVSDPGFRLVAAAVHAGLEVTVVPGPSSVTTALALSGLPSDRWCFEGFLPRAAGARRARCLVLAAEERTIVLLEAPHRLEAALRELGEAFGKDRPAVVCRELTKTHEEVVRGTLLELVAWAESKDVLGEVTLVVAGAPPGRSELDDAAIKVMVDDRVAEGESRRDAVDAVAALTGLPRKRVYALSVG